MGGCGRGTARKGRPPQKPLLGPQRSQSRLSQRVRVKHDSILLSPHHNLRYPHILVFFLWVLSFSTSSYFHIPTQRTSLVCSYERLPTRVILDTQKRRRDTGRAARLYASATLNHSLEITYVWIDSYYYKAYVGRACAVGGPTIDSPDWPSDLNFFLASFDFCYLYRRRRLSPLLNGRGTSLLLADRY